jgi:hypothetical protein
MLVVNALVLFNGVLGSCFSSCLQAKIDVALALFEFQEAVLYGLTSKTTKAHDHFGTVLRFARALPLVTYSATSQVTWWIKKVRLSIQLVN